MRRTTRLSVAAIIVIAVAAPAASARPEVAKDRRNAVNAMAAIIAVWPKQYRAEAYRVAGCETGYTYDVYARNGQYLGLWQMGSYARGRYGHSWTALGQARAAYRYFVDSGRDWSPWECKP